MFRKLARSWMSSTTTSATVGDCGLSTVRSSYSSLDSSCMPEAVGTAVSCEHRSRFGQHVWRWCFHNHGSCIVSNTYGEIEGLCFMCTTPIFKHIKSKTSSTFHHVQTSHCRAWWPGRFASLTTIHTRKRQRPSWTSKRYTCYWIGSIILEASEAPVAMQLIGRPDSQSDLTRLEVFKKFISLVLIIIKAHSLTTIPKPSWPKCV